MLQDPEPTKQKTGAVPKKEAVPKKAAASKTQLSKLLTDAYKLKVRYLMISSKATELRRIVEEELYGNLAYFVKKLNSCICWSSSEFIMQNAEPATFHQNESFLIFFW